MSVKVESPTKDYVQSGVGLKVVLSAIPGITPKGMLDSPFYFQVPPESFRHSHGHSHTDFEPLRGSQRSRKGTRQLVVCSFRTLFIDWNPAWSLLEARPGTPSTGWAPDPQEMDEALIAISESGEVVRLLVHQPERWRKAEIDMPVTLRTIEVEEQGGEPDARYVDVSFVEDRDFSIMRRAKGKADPRLPITLTIKNIPKSRRTMRGLAKFYYGSPSKWRVIAKRNRILTVQGFPINPDRDLTEARNVKKRKLVKITVPVEPKD